jgi:outer membrane protein OmpA-like peptidoglycan-associated protein
VNLADTVYQRDKNGQGITIDDNDDNTFKIKLPTAFSLQADVLLTRGLYVNLTTFTSLQGYDKPGRSHYLSTYSITPRYERKWFGVSIPIQYNQYGQFNVGLGIRAAFLYFGINNIITDVFMDPYGTSIYLGVKIPIWHKGPPTDRDSDGISDAKDRCIDTPGLWEFKGCPDTDGDGIPDADDRCPKDAGPTLTNGCPDKDNDGVIDNVDQCPDLPGPVQFNGCPDTDGDGVRDEIDQCPDTPGSSIANGCPDMDNDGVADKDDACPEQFGKREFNGCPFQDSDGDGIMDDQDLCPMVAGPAENKGCPWSDTDADGVWDKDDRCPLTPGDPLNAGCPVIKTEEAAVLKTAFENLEYQTGKAVIAASSFASLNALAKLLTDKPDWNLHIAGHTDNVGSEESNMKLSKDRAEAVAKYLKGKGLDSSRFIVEWFGETSPIADNSTPEGRQKNRRVEMEIAFD